jgi:hypothetical protein
VSERSPTRNPYIHDSRLSHRCESAQVDGLIVDEDVNRAYVYEDRRASAAITHALKMSAAGQGSVEQLLADSPQLAAAMATAAVELEGKVRGVSREREREEREREGEERERERERERGWWGMWRRPGQQRRHR